ncbi:MAG: glycosyltransferase family 1 protein [Deltaproteobacteria bacterium]|nr:glycosyltransferase family 1 protein [Deltaproteobacteria bacterium]
MNYFQTFQVLPNIPEPLSFLEELSGNYWWSWELDAKELFRRIDRELWERSGQNPVLLLANVPQKRLENLSTDPGFLDHQARVKALFDARIKEPFPVARKEIYDREGAVAYFSMEFGVHETLPIFAGGLGILAGDHLKAASTLGLPLVGVGLFYRQGYFHQRINKDGWQQEEYPETDIYHLPLEKILDEQGHEIRITIPGPSEDINAVIWKVSVGRVPLYLLDTNLRENPHHIREITARLYVSDQSIRLAQEILLGIGGVQALKAMGMQPRVFHMNEGHPVFSCLERLAQTMELHGVDLRMAREIIPRTTVFTTHTPVPAGHDEFAPEMVKPYLYPLEGRLKVSADEILSWGQHAGAGPNSKFSMFVLGLRMSQYLNGVSELHGQVARRMWRNVWPHRPEAEIPIGHVTNGIHIPSFVSRDNAMFFQNRLGVNWHRNSWKRENLKEIDAINDMDLWEAHKRCRNRLIKNCRRLLKKQCERRNAPKNVVDAAASVLDEDVLTIAFARRFATYKRANLLLRDLDRLNDILGNEDRPVQIIFAGKAHPTDEDGKGLIRHIFKHASDERLRHKIILLEDYDIHMARLLVQGADVWLNTPRRPLEACGTSGMKAAVNGVLNVSILDGWWCEGYTKETGWTIGKGEDYDAHSDSDLVDSHALYNVLENDVVPCFYDRNGGAVPFQWVKMMKASMKMILSDFSSLRMVEEYEKRFYAHASRRYGEMLDHHGEGARKMADLRERYRSKWGDISISAPTCERNSTEPVRVGEVFPVTATVYLRDLKPEEVHVELYHGSVQSLDTIYESHTEMMTVRENNGDGMYLYACNLTCTSSGQYGFSARVTPRGDELIKCTPGFVTWAEAEKEP